jgi:hypothetical protein
VRCARTSTYVSLAFACISACGQLAACSLDKTPTPSGRFPDDGGVDGGAVDAGMDAGMDAGQTAPSLLEGARVERLSSLTLGEPVVRVELAGEHVLALHDDSGVSVIDLTDPRSPAVASVIATADEVVAVRYDQAQQVALLLTASGDLRALRLSDPTAPAPLSVAQVPIPEGENASDAFKDLARMGGRLYALASAHIVPIDIAFAGDGDVALSPLPAVSIDPGAQRIAQSGPGLFVAFEGGTVRSFSATAAPAEVDEVSLGGEILGWSVRGQRIWVALEDIGVRALWVRPGAPLAVELRASELNDVKLLARSGQAMAVALDRGRIAVLDVSETAATRGIALYETSAPDWIAVAHGNLLLGDDLELHVVGVPPFVERGVPSNARQGAPRHGRTVIGFSKPLDPSAVTLESISLRCDGQLVPAIPNLALDRQSVALLPTAELPAGGNCEVRLRSVRDPLGLTASSLPDWLGFKAADGIEGFVQNGPSTEPHTAEGRMTGWTRTAVDGFEYFDIAPASGVNGDLYVDFDGARLWLFFDAVEQRDVLQRECAAVFTGFVASGLSRFTTRVFGDQTIASDGPRAVGGYAYGATKGSREPHGSFELAIDAAAGGFAVQLYLPSTSRGCELSVREPVVFSGMCDGTGCTVDGRGAVDSPATPSQIAPAETTAKAPTIRFNVSNALMSLPETQIELATQGDSPRTVYRATTYGGSIDVPAGVLSTGVSYDVRATAHNIAGVSPTATRTLTVLEAP